MRKFNKDRRILDLVSTTAALLFSLLRAPALATANQQKEVPAMATPAFAIDLFAQMAGQKGNLFLSPCSIETALAMTYAGARGATADQMSKSLHFNGGSEEVSNAFGKLLTTLNHPPQVIVAFAKDGKPVTAPAYDLVMANALWGQKGYPFNPAFTQLVQKNFQAGLNDVDFTQPEQARKAINDWVADKTRDKIKDLIGQGDLLPSTRIVLSNAIYFKSSWEEKFAKSNTKDGPFHLSADHQIDVPLMHRRSEYRYYENGQVQVVKLPYAQGELSMFILLPTQVDGMDHLEKNLTVEDLRAWFNLSDRESVDVTLPKFTFSFGLELSKPLKAMGMTDAFSPEKADFSGMSSKENFYISAVIHKAFVAVDEEGTEAAAATAVAMRAGAVRQQKEPKIFKADHPFLFFICHESTHEILFMGRLADPKGT